MEVPIKTIHLFSRLDQKLLELLKSLQPDDWSKPTLAKQWTVKDIASHLLDGNFRTLSFVRDKHPASTPKGVNSYRDLVDYLNKLNADWVIATRRLSPNVIIELLQKTGEEYCECLKTLKPFDTAIFSVAWAGQSESKNWFHIAREYTEKWHHQQQIREAVGKPGIMDREFYFPLIETFMQALPHTYRNINAPESTHIKVIVTTEVGGHWSLLRLNNQWELCSSEISSAAEISIDPSTAWKLFTKGLSGDEAKTKIQFQGDEKLFRPILSMVSVMA